MQSSPTLPAGPVTPASSRPAAPIGVWLGILEIPRISLKLVVVEGTGRGQLATGPGHYVGTAALGANGNAAVAGHRTTYGAPFAHLDRLRLGDPIIVRTSSASYLYRVDRVVTVSPTSTWVLRPTRTPTLTLTTCTPVLSATSRLVIMAHMTATTLYSTAPAVHGTVNQSQSVLSTGGWWPVALYGTLLALTLGLGARWFRRSRQRKVVVIVIALVAAPLTLQLYGALVGQLPATW